MWRAAVAPVLGYSRGGLVMPKVSRALPKHRVDGGIVINELGNQLAKKNITQTVFEMYFWVNKNVCLSMNQTTKVSLKLRELDM